MFMQTVKLLLYLIVWKRWLIALQHKHNNSHNHHAQNRVYVSPRGSLPQPVSWVLALAFGVLEPTQTPRCKARSRLSITRVITFLFTHSVSCVRSPSLL